MKDFKPFKVGPNFFEKKKEEYSPIKSHPGQFVSLYQHNFKGENHPDCEAKVAIDQFRDSLGVKSQNFATASWEIENDKW